MAKAIVEESLFSLHFPECKSPSCRRGYGSRQKAWTWGMAAECSHVHMNAQCRDKTASGEDHNHSEPAPRDILSPSRLYLTQQL